MFFYTEDLVNSAKRSEHFPTGQTTFVDPDDLIAFANEEMMTKLVPFVISNRQDFFMYWATTPLVNNLNHYAMPERAIGNVLKDIFFVPDSSTAQLKQVRYPIPSCQIHDVQQWVAPGSVPGVFYSQGDEIVVVPTPLNLSPNAALIMYYFMRPNKLVSTNQCAQITSVAIGATQVTFTVNTDLTAITTPLATGSLIDFLTNKSPFRLRAIDVSIQSITSTQVVVNLTDVQNEGSQVTPAVGDWICAAQTANIPMVPQELHPILSEMICARTNKAQGAMQNLEMSNATIKDMLQGAFKLLEYRVESEVETIYDSNSILNTMDSSTRRFVMR